MHELVWIALVAGVACYAAAGLLYLRGPLRPMGSTRGAPRTAPGLLAAGGLVHLGYVAASGAVAGQCPATSLNSALGLAAVMAVGAFLWLGAGRRLDAVGASVAAIALMLLVGSRLVVARPSDRLDRWLLALHVTANLLGLGVLLLAGLASAFYLVQEHRLKAKRPGSLGGKLPPLESLDTVVHRLLWMGLPLLTLGIISGMVVISHAQVITRGDMVRAAFSYLSWLLVAGVWTLRQARRWRGRRPAYATLAGTGCILVVILLYLVRDYWWGSL